MVRVNDEIMDLSGKTVEEYLAIANINAKRVAVELNGEIVPKAEYGSTLLKDGDEMEVVSFVGGG